MSFNAATTMPAYAPLVWAMSNSDAIGYQLGEKGGVTFTIEPESFGVVAARVTNLPAGTYQLDQVVGSQDWAPRTAMEWRVLCAAKSQPPIWLQYVPVPEREVRYRSTIAIPADCPTQLWRLTATAGDSQSPTEILLREVSLRGQ
jgi:hypothetical protein